MAGGATTRAGADVVVRPGVQTAIDVNRAAIDTAYNGLRGQIDSDVQRFTMPRTDAVLTQIMRDRQGAGWVDPAQGLEQFRNVAGGATFNGAHRARTDARLAGDVLNPHPGYNATDFNRITRAMTADLREMVQAAATNQAPAGRQAALRAFDQAERQFGPLSEANGLLNRILNAPGEGGIATMLNAAKEKGGNLQLLAQLRQTMPAPQFNAIGGLLLSELGASTRLGGEFSLAKFGTEFSKLSDQAVNVLFPQHVATQVRDIAAMGRHIGEAMQDTSTSHSSNWLAMLDMFKDIALLTHDLTASGNFGRESLIAGATTAAMYGSAWMLGNPARIASTGAFMRAYRALTFGPTPARTAAFKIATRNLANTLGVPVDKMMQTVSNRLLAPRAEQPQSESNKQPQKQQ
jgi:hypothetical protein